MCNQNLVLLDSPLTRRTLLRGGGMSAALLALSRLRALPVAAQPAAAPAGAALRVLSPRDAQILSAIGARMTFTGDPSMPRFADTAALSTIDTALLQLPPGEAQQLSWALLLFEYGPPLFLGRPSSFSGLTAQWQDAYLAGWADSRFHIRRIAFQAFKNLTMLGYYSQDATWPGDSLRRPVGAKRPRRMIWDARSRRGTAGGVRAAEVRRSFGSPHRSTVAPPHGTESSPMITTGHRSTPTST